MVRPFAKHTTKNIKFMRHPTYFGQKENFIMNMENTNVMNKETRELFNGKYCDVSICSPIMEEHDIRFCAVGYDEEETLFIIDKNGVHFELNGNEIDNVEVDNEKDIAITLTFTDGTVIVVRPLSTFEARQCYAQELMMLELTRDCYKSELLKD